MLSLKISLFILKSYSAGRLGTFQFDSSRQDQRETVTESEELFVNMSNERVDGATSSTDQLLVSQQDFYCHGKTFHQVITAHPDISQGKTSTKLFCQNH